MVLEVESYNPATDDWSMRPSLTVKKGSLSGVTLNGRIFAVGGGNGSASFSDVEMLDLDIGRWIPTRSMLQKVHLLPGICASRQIRSCWIHNLPVKSEQKY